MKLKINLEICMNIKIYSNFEMIGTSCNAQKYVAENFKDMNMRNTYECN